MVTTTTFLVICVTLASVTAQTFQYSRGWTNGKRDGRDSRDREGHKRDESRDIAAGLERIISPCQMSKLRYVLEGKPYNDRMFAPCDYLDEDSDSPKRYKVERNQEPLFEAFQ